MKTIIDIRKMGVICSCVVLYAILLSYISFVQSDFKVIIQTESDAYEFTMDKFDDYIIKVDSI